jgi:hypothetical protein
MGSGWRNSGANKNRKAQVVRSKPVKNRKSQDVSPEGENDLIALRLRPETSASSPRV